MIKNLINKYKIWRVNRMNPRAYCFHVLKGMPTDKLVKILYEYKGVNNGTETNDRR